MNRWCRKFAVARAGMIWAFKTQDSFYVHAPIAILALSLGVFLQIEPWAWAAIILSIGLVIATELLNTAIEQLVVVLHPQHDARIGRALDAAAAAVLFSAGIAVLVGLITLGPPLLRVLTVG